MAPERIVLDMDATDDLIHGKQEGRFFHGYYGNYCYLPLYIFCGEHLLCAKLRTADRDGSDGALEEIQRICAQIRTKWPLVKIILRGDSGFARDEMMSWAEGAGVSYVFGMAKNKRLTQMIAAEMAIVETRYEQSRQANRVYRELAYRTLNSWSAERRVVAKAEHLEKGSNPRFVVSNLSVEEYGGQALYEQLYCGRGDMENRIKEQQLYLFADRTSAQTMRANQLRLWFASFAYILLQQVRRIGLEATGLAKAQCHNLREKLLKIGAQIRVSVRRFVISFSSAYPYQDIFTACCRRIATSPLG
jgi:hypothetical protein